MGRSAMRQSNQSGAPGREPPASGAEHRSSASTSREARPIAADRDLLFGLLALQVGLID